MVHERGWRITVGGDAGVIVTEPIGRPVRVRLAQAATVLMMS
jgi:hypothetical protein